MSNGSEHIPERTPSTERVRDLYSWAFAWRISDDLEAGETDLSGLRATQRAEFDRWLAGVIREAKAEARTVQPTDREELFQLWLRHGSSFESDHSEGYELADALLAAGWRKETR